MQQQDLAETQVNEEPAQEKPTKEDNGEKDQVCGTVAVE